MKLSILPPAVIAAFILGASEPAFSEHKTHTDKLNEARQEANSAVTEGESGHLDALMRNISQSLAQVRMAQREPAAQDLGRVIDTLEETLKQGEMGNLDKATKHAKEAVEYLDATKGALGG